MTDRIIRTGIISSERVDRLSAEAEVFYRRLLNKVDDYGLHDARPTILIAELYPLRVKTTDEAQIAAWIGECERSGLVLWYESDGKPFLQVLDTKWQQRSKPRCPLPTDKDRSLASARLRKQLRTIDNNCYLARARPRVVVDVDVAVGAVVGVDGVNPSDPPPAGEGSAREPAAQDPPKPTHKTQSTGNGSPKASHPRKPAPETAAATAPATIATWEAYRDGYLTRYQTEPLRNATVNGQLARIVGLVGKERAPLVARHYLTSNDPRAVREKHPVGFLLQSIQRWATEAEQGHAPAAALSEHGRATLDNLRSFVEGNDDQH